MSEFSIFLGRFHPLFVHLPIGFLFLAVLMDFVPLKLKGQIGQHAIRFAWFWGAVFATLSIGTGWFLAQAGGYPEGDLNWHRWLGILTAGLSWLGWLVKRGTLPNRSLDRGITAGIALLLILTGHLGGNLTHGKGYLTEYAPFFKSQTPPPDSIAILERPLDSIIVYQDLIHPVLAKKCLDCHNDVQQDGGLNMSTPEDLMEGGDHGSIIETGNPFASEIIARVILPRDDKHFMPLKGIPLTYEEIRLLEWWIGAGAKFETSVKGLKTTPSIVTILEQYGIDLTPKPLVERLKLKAPKLSSDSLAPLQELGFSIQALAANNDLVEVSWKGDTLPLIALKALKIIQGNITWLNLGNTNLQDAHLEIIGQFPNLTRLRVDRNPITGSQLSHLTPLKNLESLNLYQTEVNDSIIDELSKMKGLKTVFLWQTRVSRQGVAQLANALPEMEIDTGFVFIQAGD